MKDTTKVGGAARSKRKPKPLMISCELLCGVLITVVFLVGCAKRGTDLAAGSTPADASPNDILEKTVSKTPGNRNDVLSRHSIDELMEVLKDRGNKSVYVNESKELNDISSSAIADDIIFRQKTIYEKDGLTHRKDYWEIQDHEVLKVADSVASVIPVGHIQEGLDTVKIVGRTLGETYDCCADEAYISQPSAGECSAFIVAPDVVATAGHCVPYLTSGRIVFGFRVTKSGGAVQFQTTLPKSQVYRAAQVLAQNADRTGLDFALIRVDRKISDHVPLSLDIDGASKGTIVYALGYPLGLPLKLAEGAMVSRVVEARGYFVSNLDTFGGNSGSPVLKAASNQVIGILSRGGKDFRAVGSCNRMFVCPVLDDSTVDCGGESATLLSRISDSLASIANNKSAPIKDPIVKTFRSGERLSGSGKNFSVEYELGSDAPPTGYKVGNFTYSLSGDRGCNAWSTCRTSVEGNRVVFRFSLQGHDEWLPPGQAKSEGFLTVTYIPVSP